MVVSMTIVQHARLRRNGRIGTVMQHDPADDEICYKLQFNDGETPKYDWFARGDVELLGAAETHVLTSDEESLGSPHGEGGREIHRGGSMIVADMVEQAALEEVTIADDLNSLDCSPEPSVYSPAGSVSSSRAPRTSMTAVSAMLSCPRVAPPPALTSPAPSTVSESAGELRVGKVQVFQIASPSRPSSTPTCYGSPRRGAESCAHDISQKAMELATHVVMMAQQERRTRKRLAETQRTAEYKAAKSERLASELADTRGELDEQRRSFEDLASELFEQGQTAERARAAADERATKFEDLVAVVDEQALELAAARDAHKLEVEAARKYLEMHRSETSWKEADLETAQIPQERVEKLTADLECRSREMRQVRNELRAHESRVADQAYGIEAIDAELVATTEQSEAYQARLKDVLCELEASNEHRRAYQTRFEHMLCELETYQSKIDDVHTEAQNYKTRCLQQVDNQSQRSCSA
eukprot:TRINITY_DN22869_c0_g1_i3.p1 TRINITY_DN22869_c0_g1~~TRINITY_DN22869_c0_g1_i3.p1  ORF type:complete len:497 (-),score=104.44 TRINITY_DN22869_c0_g1_i3:260-1672(-)